MKLENDGSVSGETESRQGDRLKFTGGTFDKQSGDISWTVETARGEREYSGNVFGNRMSGETMKGTIEVGGGELEIEFEAKRTSKPTVESDEAKPNAEADQQAGEQTDAGMEEENVQDQESGSEDDVLSGNWKGVLNRPDGSESEMLLTIKKSTDGKISGSWETDRGEGDIDEGSFNIESGRLMLTSVSDDLELDFIGKVVEGKYSGEIEYGEGQFSMDFQVSRSTDDQSSDAQSSGAQSGVRVIREDIENENLLYLGCEFSAWFSLDRGQTWNRFSGLPTVAVHEFAIHPQAGEIVAATHGRSLWIADVRLLRQLTNETLSEDVYLFEPGKVVRWQRSARRGENGTHEFRGDDPPQNTSITYSLANDVRAVDLTISDWNGEILKRFEDAPRTSGLHRLEWDLRRNSNRGRGASVGAGSYRVTLKTTGGRGTTLNQKLEVVRDPNLPSDAVESELNEGFQVEAVEDAGSSDNQYDNDSVLWGQEGLW